MMITNKTARDLIIAKKLFPGGGSVIVTDTATGSISNFETNMVAPIVKGICEINPIQEGTGDPSPSNPRPISGTSVLNVTRTGKNLFNGTNVLQMYLTSTKVLANTAARLIYIECKPNTTYTISKTAGSRFSAGYTTEMPANNVDVYAGSQTDVTSSHITILTGANAKYLVSYVYNSNVDTITAEEMIASCQIELGSTATTYEPYTGSTYTIALGRTVYGGSAEVVGGTGEETYGYIASYNGEEINEPWLSSIDPYVQGTTPSTGAEVVYPLSTPTPFTFTGQEINSLEGVNNVWHDGNGNISVTYKKKVPGQGGIDKRQFLPLIYGKKYYRKEY